MRVTHELTYYGTCPANGAPDTYSVTVETRRMVAVEDIIAALSALPKPLYQEEITERLAAAINCTVTTIGHHSGVKTTCSA